MICLFPSKGRARRSGRFLSLGRDHSEAEGLVFQRDGNKNGWACPVSHFASVFPAPSRSDRLQNTVLGDT